MISGSNLFAADAAEIKAALAVQAEAFVAWLFPEGRRRGVNYVVASLAGEKGRSLSICISGAKTGVWKDFASGVGGDNLLELLRAAKDCTFAEACPAAADWLRLPYAAVAPGLTENRSPKAESAPAAPYRLNGDEIRRGITMAERLIGNARACEAIARRRDWQPATVLALAQEASLGLSDDNHLTFLYDCCAKERQQVNGEKVLYFLYGKADALWRGGLLPIASRVFITEGETDAISLIDAGAEDDGDTLVVSVPSATTIKPWWGQQLAGKSIVLCMDADDSGRTATAKLEPILVPHVSDLRILDLEELLK